MVCGLLVGHYVSSNSATGIKFNSSGILTEHHEFCLTTDQILLTRSTTYSSTNKVYQHTRKETVYRHKICIDKDQVI